MFTQVKTESVPTLEYSRAPEPVPAKDEEIVQFENYCTRPYRNGDELAINDGFNQIFGLQRPLSEWSWKFRPENGDWILVAEDENQQLIAHFAVNRQFVKVDDAVFCAGQAVDVYRIKRPGTDGRLCFSATVKDFYRRYGKPEEINFLFGFPGKRHMSMGRVRLKYVDPIRVPVWRRATRAWTLDWPRYTLEENCRAEDLDALWNKSSHRYPVAVVRDGARYLRRYTGHPSNKYICVTAWTATELNAWAVFKLNQDALLWIDLLWDGKDKQILAALESYAHKLAKRAEVSRLEMWLAQDADTAKMLREHGWTLGEHQEQLELTSVVFNPVINGEKLVRDFYFTMGDSDLV